MHTHTYTHTHSVIVLTVGLTSNWPITVNMRDSPTGVHTDEKRQEAALNTHKLIYAFLKQKYECNI